MNALRVAVDWARLLLVILWAVAARRPAVHSRARLPGGLELALWDRPGRCLDATSLARLVEDLRVVAARAVGPAPSEYGPLRLDRAEQAERSVVVLYRARDHRPLAFSAQRYFDVPREGRSQRIVHMGLVCVDPGLRGRRCCHLIVLFATLFQLLRSGLRGVWFSNVSQVPSVLGQVAHYYARVYPSPLDGAKQTQFHREVAQHLFERQKAAFGVGEDASFDPDLQIIRNAYTGGSDSLKKDLVRAPRSKDPAVNRFCREHLDYGRGDDFLQLARFDLPALARYTMRRLRGGRRSTRPRMATPPAVIEAAELSPASA